MNKDDMISILQEVLEVDEITNKDDTFGYNKDKKSFRLIIEDYQDFNALDIKILLIQLDIKNANDLTMHSANSFRLKITNYMITAWLADRHLGNAQEHYLLLSTFLRQEIFSILDERNPLSNIYIVLDTGKTKIRICHPVEPYIPPKNISTKYFDIVFCKELLKRLEMEKKGLAILEPNIKEIILQRLRKEAIINLCDIQLPFTSRY